MGTSRRDFLTKTLFSGIVAGVGPSALAASPDGNEPDLGAVSPAVRETLAAVFETFVPDDSSGPGAVQSGALAEYLGMLEKRPPGRRNWIALACRWLDAQAARLGAPSFVMLDEGGRDEVIARAADAPEDTGEHRFFEDMRRTVFQLHYSRPQTWSALGYHGPPQPIGFPDYASPPEDRG